MPRSARNFAFCVLFFFSPLLLFIVSVKGALWKTGETIPASIIASRQQSEEIVWLRDSFDQAIFPYKSIAYEMRKPRIVALGSSRAMKFRSQMFGRDSTGFFNGGGLIRSIADLERFEASLNASNTPQIILLGIDHWWLNGRLPDEPQHLDDAVFNWRAHMEVWRRLAKKQTRKDGQPAIRERLQLALKKNDVRTVGIRAQLTGGGFRSDGSKASEESPPVSAQQWRLPDNDWLNKLRRGEGDCLPTTGVDPELRERLRAVLQQLQKRNIFVLIFAPPLSSEAAKIITHVPHQKNLWSEYLRDTKLICAQLKIPFCDASTPDKLHLTDVYMSDEKHAEETFHLYILREWLKDPRVQKALPDTSRVVEAALASPHTNYWFPDLSAASQ